MSAQPNRLLALPSSIGAASALTLNALPYIDDPNYTETHRQFALQLIEAECRAFPMTKNYLKAFPEPQYDAFLTPRVKEQLAAIAEKKDIERIDMKRYDVPAPSGTKVTDKRAWLNAIQNAKAQLSNQHLRQMNLELMEEYGPESFLQHNKQLQRDVEADENLIVKLRNRIYEINARRKRSQLAAGEQLDQLGQEWVELVSKNARMEIDLLEMERELQRTAKRLKVDAE